jgi:hypothetical protein
MNYQYTHDGTTPRYIVNGVEYNRIEDVPAEHRDYFVNIDKNNNGIPDSIEPLWDAVSSSSGKPNMLKLFGALFKTVRQDMTSGNTIDISDFNEVKETKQATQPSSNVQQKRNYDSRGNVMQQGEKSMIPTIIMILVVVLIGLTVAWYFGVIK